MSDLFKFSAVELGGEIRSGAVSAVEAAKAALARIAESDHNAYITVLEDRALEQAEAVQEKLARGELESPLAGVPVAVKDNLCTEYGRTSCASKMLADYRSPFSATAVERLEAAGAVVLGKTNLDAFSMGATTETSYYGGTVNPWSRDHVPGDGGAAAVAAGEAWYAVGTDTCGGVRRPAGFCGLTGLRPTYGAISRYGVVAYASSMDQIGPMGRSAADCAAALDMMAGRDRRDATSLDIQGGSLLAALKGAVSGTRIALPEACFGDGVSPEVRARVLAVADVLKELGAEVETVSMPHHRYAAPALSVIAFAEASSNLSRFDGMKYGYRAAEFTDLLSLYENTRTEGFGREVKKRILLGNFFLSDGQYDTYFKKAQQIRGAVSQNFAEIFSKWDLILSPVSPDTAPRIGRMEGEPQLPYQLDRFTAGASLAGLPALSMPCGADGDGLPVGAQLIGPPLGEQCILDTAHGYQQATAYHREMPKGGEA